MKLNELNQEENELPNSNNIISIEQKEGIKLTRNASSIYQWEIETLNLDAEDLVKIDDGIRAGLDKRKLKYEKEVKKDGKR